MQFTTKYKIRDTVFLMHRNEVIVATIMKIIVTMENVSVNSINVCYELHSDKFVDGKEHKDIRHEKFLFADKKALAAHLIGE